MSGILAIILIIVCLALAFFVLIQNPKGGGLSGGIGTVGTQMMGVQSSTDTVEKGTWMLAAVMALLCILSVAFGDRKTGKMEKSRSEKAVKNARIETPAAPTAPANTAPMPSTSTTPAATTTTP